MTHLTSKPFALVTGGAGFIGFNLIRHLLHLDYKVVAVDNFDDYYSANKRSNIMYLSQFENFDFFELNILTAQDLEDHLDFNFDFIIHLAAIPGVRTSFKNSEKVMNTNFEGTKKVFEFAKQKGIRRFIFSSSSSIYGNNKNVPWKESENEVIPLNPYAKSKYLAEQYLLENSSTVECIILRFFSVYGPFQRPDLVLPKFHDSLVDGRKIEVYGDMSTSRDYTHVDDVARVIAKVMALEKLDSPILNVCKGESVSLAQLIQHLELALQVQAKINITDYQKGESYQTLGDNRLLNSIFPDYQFKNIREGIQDYIDWRKSENKYE